MAALACILMCQGVLASNAAAREEITHFDVTIAVQPDGDLIVTEAITVRAEGREIRRGIYRDIPLRSADERGMRREAGFELLSIERNKRAEPYHTKRTGNGIRIYIGQEDVFIRPGTHHYVIRYRSARQLRQFEDFDEVYWNATGNQWTFPIRKASARVSLPEDARVLEHAGYTGRFGENGTDYRARKISPRTMQFQTTRALNPGEGLTVAVSFPKGFVPEDAQSGTVLDQVWANLGLGALGAGLLAVFGTLFSSWRRVGVDPKPRPVIPRFKAPEGLSPGAVAYLYNQGFRKGPGGHQAFSAAMTSMAVKGRAIIDKTSKNLSLESSSAPLHVLSEDERAIDTALLSGGGRFDFTAAAGPTMVSALDAFYASIRKPLEGVYFDTNRGYTVLGIIMSVVSVMAFLVVDKPNDETMLRVIFTAVPGVVAALLLFKAHELWIGSARHAAGLDRACLLTTIAIIPLTIIGLVLYFSMHSLFFTAPGCWGWWRWWRSTRSLPT
jgi:hypothetical protein